MKLRDIDHSGKTVFVAIDVHKKTYKLAIGGEHIPREVTMTTPADPVKLSMFLLKTFVGAKIRSVYEAGFSGFVLHRELQSNGVENIVINPASIEVAANDRVKNDKRDAKKMLAHLMRNQLTGIYVPTIEEELRRELSRTRSQLVRKRSSIGNQIKSKLTAVSLILE